MPSFWEKIQVAGKEVEMYASVPSGSGPFPAVIVSHHATGIDDFIQAMCDRLAAAGYAAVSPNLFHRITDEMLADGSRPTQHLNDPDIVSDINTTVDWLRNHPAIDGQHIGVTGFCMGGRVAWLAAATNPHIKATVPYYGGNLFVKWGNPEQTPFELATNINCPILFHFGELDINPSAEDKARLDAELTRLGKEHQFYTYPGADHGFMDFTRHRHNKEAEETSWPRTLEFFDQHLKGAVVTR
jgi:carboxymethylenebutenolidase